jgi:hypothetical protein
VEIRRDKAEASLLMPVYNDVLEPKRIERMAKELQSAFLTSQRAEQTKTTQVPAEMQVIEERIERLRARLRNGDPDLAPDELEAALVKAEEKRRSLLASPSSVDGARVIALLNGPSACSAEDYTRIGIPETHTRACGSEMPTCAIASIKAPAIAPGYCVGPMITRATSLDTSSSESLSETVTSRGIS